MSSDYLIYKKKLKIKNILIHLIRILILLLFIILWEYLSTNNIINSFIFSSPSKVIKIIIDLYINNNLLKHIYITSIEVIISFIICFIISFILALILFLFPILKKVLDPYIILFNGLPKIALGPLIIILIGSNTKSIIFNSLLISTIITMISILNGMNNIEKDKIKLFKIFKASKYDYITKLIIPSSFNEIISSLKINLSMSLIGVIMGEFLCCKAGIGYLILYGTQVFNLSLVIAGIIILLLLSFIFYLIINLLDKKTSLLD